MLSIESNLSAFVRGLQTAERQVGFAQTVALTRTARATVEHLRRVMMRVFDRPTRFALRGVSWWWATPNRQAVDVFVQRGAKRFLGPQILGGGRPTKRSEAAIANSILTRDALGNRAYWTPGPGVTLDAYGNVPGSTIRRILSDLRVAGDQSRTARSRKRNKRYRGERYFIPPRGSGLAPAVWVERGGQLLPALFLVHEPSYARRFPFFEEGERFAVSEYPRQLGQALAEGWHLPKQVQRSLFGRLKV